MNDVFILGAGFSKAISREMPLTAELAAAVLKRYSQASSISSETRHMIEEDLEKALTFLSQENPWLSRLEWESDPANRTAMGARRHLDEGFGGCREDLKNMRKAYRADFWKRQRE